VTIACDRWSNLRLREKTVCRPEKYRLVEMVLLLNIKALEELKCPEWVYWKSCVLSEWDQTFNYTFVLLLSHDGLRNETRTSIVSRAHSCCHTSVPVPVLTWTRRGCRLKFVFFFNLLGNRFEPFTTPESPYKAIWNSLTLHNLPN